MAFVDKKETGMKTIVKGFLTGGTQACITYPTEFVKTQLQLQSKANPEFNGIADCVRKTVRNHGVTGLYRGAGVRIFGAGFQQMFRWGGYTNISYYFRDEKGKITPFYNAVSGMGGGICEAVGEGDGGEYWLFLVEFDGNDRRRRRNTTRTTLENHFGHEISRGEFGLRTQFSVSSYS